MGALRLVANTGLGIGRLLRIVGSKFCCWEFGLGGAFGCKENLLRGTDYLLSEKAEK